MDFQNETAKECVDVPFTIVGKEIETEKNKQKMGISDSFVTGFAIFVIAFGLIMLKICWIQKGNSMYELGRIIGYVIFVGFIIGILWGAAQ